MSSNYRPYAADSPSNESSATMSRDGNAHSTTATAGNGASPLANLEVPESEPSPWSGTSVGSGYDSLTLPPINPNNNYDDNHLPSFDDEYFVHHSPGLSGQSNSRNSNATPQSLPRTLQSAQAPPPSNQQARRPTPPAQQYRYDDFNSDNDPFEDFIDLYSPPGDMNTRSNRSTRQSSFVDLTESSPVISNAMAPSKKRKAAAPAEGKAKKIATARPGSSRSSRSMTGKAANKEESVDLVDLVDVDDLPDYEELRAKEQAELIKKQNLEAATKSVKLAEFQCIICMDNPTDLTVTYCGHLFCSECLHQALYAGDKKCCPVCRSQIATPKPGAKQPRNGVFALEMKFMTKNKKGKQAVRS